MEKTIKVKMNSEPHRLRGVSPDKVLLFPGDPDMDILNPLETGKFSALYESCKPKFTKNTGTILVFGTGGPLN